jgi:hypothetical protein
MNFLTLRDVAALKPTVPEPPAVSGNPHPRGGTDVRLRSDEPKTDQHQHAGQDGEQEAIGNAGRQVATD